MSLVSWLLSPPSAPPGRASRPSSALPERIAGQVWHLDDPLYTFATIDARGRKSLICLTIGQSFQGTVVFGRTGSGKTSGTAANLSRAMLRAGYGGLVLCAKPGEAAAWQARAEATGRAEDLIFIREGGEAKLNFLDYELTEGSRNAEGVVGLLSAMAEVLSPDDVVR